jgi:peptidyl-prolyl cis-trans isomerase D
MQRIPTAADSQLKPFIKQVALQQVLLKKADSAKVQLPPEEHNNLYSSISQLVANIWGALGVDPKMLADSAKSTAEKERLASARVDSYLDRMMAGQAQPLSVPRPLKKLLDAKYESSVNPAGIDRGFERAQKLRASADSARAANQPKSAIPLPGAGGPPGGPPPGTQPQPQPQPKAPPATKKP